MNRQHTRRRMRDYRKRIVQYIEVLEKRETDPNDFLHKHIWSNISASYAAHIYAAFLAKKGAITPTQHESIKSQLASDDEARYVALVLLKNLSWRRKNEETKTS